MGDKKKNLLLAIKTLREKVLVKNISSFYYSTPVDYLDQDSFVNVCLEVTTSLPPPILLSLVQKIEKKMHRQKIIDRGPRIIDIDIVFYRDRVIKMSGLQIPHPRYYNRMFVLMPLIEIIGNVTDPQTKKNLYYYYNKNFPKQKVIKMS